MAPSGCAWLNGLKLIESFFFAHHPSERFPGEKSVQLNPALKCMAVSKSPDLSWFSPVWVRRGRGLRVKLPVGLGSWLRPVNRFVCPYLSFYPSCHEQLAPRH